MTVETQENGHVKISELKYGDLVKTYDTTALKWKYTKVIAYLHKDDSIITEYYQIKTDSNETLKISGKHLIAKYESIKQNYIFVYAKDLQVNDLIQLNSNRVKINKIDIISERGAYAPLTEDGTLYVNNVFVSCYAKIQSHKIAHFVMKPIIYLTNYFNSNSYLINEIDSSAFNGKTFWYAEFLHGILATLPSQISNFIYSVKL